LPKRRNKEGGDKPGLPPHSATNNVGIASTLISKVDKLINLSQDFGEQINSLQRSVCVFRKDVRVIFREELEKLDNNNNNNKEGYNN
jgi:hypothetical protein